MSAAELEIRRFRHDDLPQIRQTIIDLHAAAAGPDRDDDPQAVATATATLSRFQPDGWLGG